MKNSKVWWIVGGLAVLVGGAIWFAISTKNGMPSYSLPGTKKTIVEESSGQPTAPAPAVGAYVDYNAETFANTQGRRWLFFHAGWCPQCRALEKDIKDQGVPDGLTIFKVNYDTETDLKKKYGVTLQTTVVQVDSAGKEIQKFVAYDDPTLEAVIKAMGG